MNASVIQLAAIPVVMIQHTGPYDEIGPEFERLIDWVKAYGIPAGRTIGIYWDNPDYTPASKLRSAACVEVPVGYQPVADGGLPLTTAQLLGGPYVTTRFVGPYEDLAPVWSNLTSYIENTLRRTISDHPAFEIYLNDPACTPPDQLITELYMPVL